MPIKVAAVQFAPTLKDPSGNLSKLTELVALAAKNGAQLVVLPELCTSGYSFMDEEEAMPFAEVLTDFVPPQSADEGIAELRAAPNSMLVMWALSKRYNIAIAWGVLEKDAATGKLYNTQVLRAPGGGIWEFYRKVNLWGNDFLWASEGRANPPVLKIDFDGVTKKVGLLICRDVRDKKDDTWKSFYQKGDADLVAFSANWGDGGFPSVTWMEFAKDNDTTLIVSNRYKKEENNDFGEGGVCVIEPSGKVHCKGLVWNQNCIVYAEV